MATGAIGENGLPNLIEFAVRQDGHPPAPGLVRLVRTPWDTWGIHVLVRDDPGITVVAEFAPGLDFTGPAVSGGSWDPLVDGYRHVLFASQLTTTSTTAFARLVVHQLSPPP